MFITCGVVITDGKNLLICHPTHGRMWDLPKGRQDPGETDIETAVRETLEETGLVIDPTLLVDLGRHSYKPGKTLSLFKLVVDEMPDPALLVCKSMFMFHGREIPEMDAFVVASIPHALEKVNKDLARILMDIL